MAGEGENDAYNERFYSFYLLVFVVVILCITVAAFLLGNPWLSLGVVVFLLSSWIAWVIVPALFIYALTVWLNEGFSFSHPAGFFLACSICSALLFYFARKKVLTKREDGKEN